MEIGQIAQAATVVAAGGLGLAYAIQRFMQSWKSTSAEGSVLDLMHKELERMSEQNTTLSEELGKLQGEIIKLNHELTKLTVENQRLHLEVSTLNHEIARLKGAINKETNNGSAN